MHFGIKTITESLYFSIMSPVNTLILTSLNPVFSQWFEMFSRFLEKDSGGINT
jgi:hypothetical protein